MKNKILLIVAFLISICVNAQQGINYKAIIKDASGNVVANDLVQVRFAILTGISNPSDNNYVETHTPTTDANGLVILNIGEGTVNSGVFADIDWASGRHFLSVYINIGEGFVDMGTTEFMSVPYAKHAETAAVAENVFSGDYNDLINQPTTIATGLESIDEGNGSGWRLIGNNPENYGEIGSGAVDLSFSDQPSDLMGASGGYSTAMGAGTVASGDVSTAMGFGTVASGAVSTAMGYSTQASSFASTAMGYFTKASGYNSVAMGSFTNAESLNSMAVGKFNIGGGNSEVWVVTDPLFEIGNGLDAGNKNNALTIYKDGNAQFDGEIQHTATGAANLVPIAYGLIESNGNILNGTGNFTASVSNNVFTININNETFNHENNVCFITPISGGFRTSSISSSGGNVTVRIFNSDGNTTSSSFQFMVYKL